MGSNAAPLGWEAGVLVAVLAALLFGLVQSSLPAVWARRALHLGTSALVLFAEGQGHRDVIVGTAVLMLLGHLPFVPLGWLWDRFRPDTEDPDKG